MSRLWKFKKNVLLYGALGTSVLAYGIERDNRTPQIQISSAETSLNEHLARSGLFNLIHEYNPPYFARIAHLSVILNNVRSNYFSTKTKIDYTRLTKPYSIQLGKEKISLGSVSFDIAMPEKTAQRKGSVIVLVLGVAGYSSDPMTQEFIKRAVDDGYTCAVLNHFVPMDETKDLRLIDFGDTEMIQEAIEHLKTSLPSATTKKLYAVGFSLGGNYLMLHVGKMLAQGKKSPFDAVLTVG